MSKWRVCMLSAAIIAGCAAQAPLPEESYYRLHMPQAAGEKPELIEPDACKLKHQCVQVECPAFDSFTIHLESGWATTLL